MTKAAPIASTKTKSFPALAPRILFEDQHLIVLTKPSGLLSQGEETGQPNLVDWLRVYLGRPYVGLIHRLDRNTSGLMLIGKRTKSAQRLTDSLQKGDVFRSYLAWVAGTLTSPQTWTHYLLKNTSQNISQVVKPPAGKIAVLSVRPVRQYVEQGRPVTLVEFTLETGRSHQIRVQSSYEGFPLLGDLKYGNPRQRLAFPRVALHSHHLKFMHPMSQAPLEFFDPLPVDLDLGKSKSVDY